MRIKDQLLGEYSIVQKGLHQFNIYKGDYPDKRFKSCSELNEAIMEIISCMTMEYDAEVTLEESTIYRERLVQSISQTLNYEAIKQKYEALAKIQMVKEKKEKDNATTGDTAANEESAKVLSESEEVGNIQQT